MSRSTPTAVLRGSQADGASFARLGGELRDGTAARYGVDPRLADPALEQAFADAVGAAREDARRGGYDDGHRAGLLAAAAQTQQLHRELAAAEADRQDARDETTRAVLAGLVAAAQELGRRQAVALSQDADLLLRTAVDLAEVLVGDHVQARTDPGLDAVRRALAALPTAPERVVLHLHPQDAQALDGRALDELAAGAALVVVPDPAVERGGCVAQSGATTVDAQLGSALARVRAELAS